MSNSWNFSDTKEFFRNLGEYREILGKYTIFSQNDNNLQKFYINGKSIFLVIFKKFPSFFFFLFFHIFLTFVRESLNNKTNFMKKLVFRTIL